MTDTERDELRREITRLAVLAEGLTKTIGELQAINTALIAEVETSASEEMT